ncbi:MAG: bifunctional [glutamate--ammonia ligase]-adenylyl-L-tyrosine phosphorylase/[glutamate--ammonia-ligase] adenylyltransferase, partial [Pseudomonadota bacterium]
QESQIQELWEQSLFATRVCKQYPALVNELPEIKEGGAIDYLNILEGYISEVEDDNQFRQKLREFRNKYFLFICWRELVLKTNVLVLLKELSLIADACIQISEQWYRLKLIEKYGEPITDSGEPAHLVVIALGKLGGFELNFSSDIDIMFCFSESGHTQGVRSISNQEFFLQLSQKIIKALSDITSGGFVFRVDCRLRPFGESGPLAVNFNHLEEYFQIHGREWERYAFIKSRVVVGSKKDCEQFNNIVSSFVYRRYIDFGVITTLREMKDMIAKQVVKKGYAGNIKLGAGGIREIEFIVQFFQLVHGGVNPRLQTRSLVEAYQEVAVSGYLDSKEVERLLKAYEFHRRVENRLQMRNDEQTHLLPVNEDHWQMLSSSMGFVNTELFKQTLQTHLDQVSRLFSQIRSDSEGENPEKNAYMECWDNLIAGNESEDPDTYSSRNFKDLAHVCDKLRQLVESAAFRAQDKASRQRLKRFMPVFLSCLQESDSPALVMDRLNLLLQNILRRSAYLVLLYENQNVLKQLISVTSSSPWIASHITSYPLLMDDLVVTTEDDYCLSKQEIEQQFNNEVLRHSDLGYDAILERVRFFKHAHELHVACADVQNKLPLMKVSDQLTWIAEVIVNGCVKYLEEQFDPQMQGNLAVIAFGKLGGIELSYGSDLDLVYISNNPQESSYPQDAKVPYVVKITKFAQRLTQMLALQTVSGQLYEVDTRLRPDGVSGAIVPPFNFVQQYYETRCWTWELQALVRTRCISGSNEVESKFNKMRQDILCRPRDNVLLASEVASMRSKMLETKKTKQAGYFHVKNDEGGITDIEFMVQYAVLAHAHENNSLCEYSDNVRLLERLAGGGFLSTEMTAELTEIYCRFRNTMHRMALQSQKPLIDESEYQAERKFVRQCWKSLIGSQ